MSLRSAFIIRLFTMYQKFSVAAAKDHSEGPNKTISEISAVGTMDSGTFTVR